MKVMSREFTTTEKVLIVILSIVLLGLVYYRFVYLTTNDMIQENKAEEESVQSELDIANAKLQRLKKIEKELGDVKIENAPKMESYNNSKKETAFLNKVLSGVGDYSISFSELTRDKDQIRRSFTLKFAAKSYTAAEKAVAELTNGKYRCLIDDINYALTDNGDIYIDLTATFFETMVGGTEDSALPKDESKDDQGSEE